MAQGDYYTLKAQKKILEKAFKQGRISQETYTRQVAEIDKQIVEHEAQDYWGKWGFKGKIRNEHIIVNLNCPCGWRGIVTHGQMQAELIGKDRRGFIYFRCPKCKEHLQYDPTSGKIKTRKGILGFLFGRFS